MSSTINIAATNRQIYRIADALMFVLRIPAGDSLGPLLASAGSDNRNAVAHWVREQLRDPVFDDTSPDMATLAPRLLRTLRALEQGDH